MVSNCHKNLHLLYPGLTVESGLPLKEEIVAFNGFTLILTPEASEVVSTSIINFLSNHVGLAISEKTILKGSPLVLTIDGLAILINGFSEGIA